MNETATSTVDPDEIAKFSAMAAEWWDPSGKFKPLHVMNPVRLAYVRDQIAAHYDREVRVKSPLDGLTLLDIGCGGGLLAEPLTRLGAEVTGADMSEVNIKIASGHAEAQGLNITYRHSAAEDLVAEGAQFDVVVALEIIEHVADVQLLNADHRGRSGLGGRGAASMGRAGVQRGGCRSGGLHVPTGLSTDPGVEHAGAG